MCGAGGGKILGGGSSVHEDDAPPDLCAIAQSCHWQ